MAASLESQGWYLSELKVTELLNNGCNRDTEIAKCALDVDLKSLSTSKVLDNFTSNKGSKLRVPLVVQISSVNNISAPTYRQESQAAPRMFMFTLTDGVKSVSALEMEPINGLSFDTGPGMKLLLLGNIKTNGKLLLLTNTNCKLLGGKVDDMYDAWVQDKQMKNLSRIMNRDDGPPPFVPFGQKIKVNSVQKVTGKFRSLDVASGGKLEPKEDAASTKFAEDRNAVISEAMKTGKVLNVSQLYDSASGGFETAHSRSTVRNMGKGIAPSSGFRQNMGTGTGHKLNEDDILDRLVKVKPSKFYNLSEEPEDKSGVRADTKSDRTTPSSVKSDIKRPPETKFDDNKNFGMKPTPHQDFKSKPEFRRDFGGKPTPQQDFKSKPEFRNEFAGKSMPHQDFKSKPEFRKEFGARADGDRNEGGGRFGTRRDDRGRGGAHGDRGRGSAHGTDRGRGGANGDRSRNEYEKPAPSRGGGKFSRGRQNDNEDSDYVQSRPQTAPSLFDFIATREEFKPAEQPSAPNHEAHAYSGSNKTAQSQPNKQSSYQTDRNPRNEFQKGPGSQSAGGPNTRGLRSEPPKQQFDRDYNSRPYSARGDEERKSQPSQHTRPTQKQDWKSENRQPGRNNRERTAEGRSDRPNPTRNDTRPSSSKYVDERVQNNVGNKPNPTHLSQETRPSARAAPQPAQNPSHPPHGGSQQSASLQSSSFRQDTPNHLGTDNKFFKVGDLVMARFWQDGQFYVYHIQNTVAPDVYFGVFVEYGNMEEVHIRDMMPMNFGPSY